METQPSVLLLPLPFEVLGHLTPPELAIVAHTAHGPLASVISFALHRAQRLWVGDEVNILTPWTALTTVRRALHELEKHICDPLASVESFAWQRAKRLGVGDDLNTLTSRAALSTVLTVLHKVEKCICCICLNRLNQPAAGTTKAELDEDDCKGCHIVAGACGHCFHSSCLDM